MKICMSEITTLPLPLSEDLPAFAKAGFRAVELSIDKTNRFIASSSLERLVGLLSDLEMTATGAIGLAPQGPALLLARGATFDDYLKLLREQFELCRALGIAQIGIGADASKWRDEEVWQPGAVANVKRAAEMAADNGIRIGLEFMSLGAPIGPFILDTLAETKAMVGEVDHPAVGYNIDFFHHYRGGGNVEELATADPARIIGVHVTDVGPRERQALGDGDRVLPGDGVLPVMDYRDALIAAGYDGYWVLELLNEALWKRDAVIVAEMGKRAMDQFASG